jgi:excinuclease UvrABC ATPase subunit
VIDMGPRAGSAGGEVVVEGSYAELLEADTLTGRHLRQALPIKESFRQPTGQLPIRHARANNSGMPAPTTSRTSTSTSRPAC